MRLVPRAPIPRAGLEVEDQLLQARQPPRQAALFVFEEGLPGEPQRAVFGAVVPEVDDDADGGDEGEAAAVEGAVGEGGEAGGRVEVEGVVLVEELDGFRVELAAYGQHVEVLGAGEVLPMAFVPGDAFDVEVWEGVVEGGEDVETGGLVGFWSPGRGC